MKIAYDNPPGSLQNAPADTQISQTTPRPQEYQTTFKPWIKNYKVLGYYLNILSVPMGSPEATALQSAGYRFSRNSFSKAIKTEQDIASIQSELSNIESSTGCTFSDAWLLEARREAFPEQRPTPQSGDESQQQQQVQQILDSQGIDNIKKKELADDFVRNKIDELGKLTDQSAKNEFIMRFLAIRPEFHDYSFVNKILMLIQNPQVSPFVAGKWQWENPDGKFKRRIREGEHPMKIFSPESNQIYIASAKIVQNMLNDVAGRMSKIDDGYAFANRMLKNEYQKDFLRYCLSINGGDVRKTAKYIEDQIKRYQRYGRVYYGVRRGSNGQTIFKTSDVYDISQTEPIDNNSFQAPEKNLWQSNQNQHDPMIQPLTTAAIEWAKGAKFQMGNEWQTGIDVDLNYQAGSEGGWSMGSKIAVDRMSAGLRQLATVVHEIAHSLLHFGPNKSSMTPKQKEIEAEATVFVVLNFFGFTELEFAANYLALHQATSNDVLDRYSAIDSVARKIIKGIQEKLETKTANWISHLRFRKFASVIWSIDELVETSI